MSTPVVRVWQIYFKPQQIAHLDPFFVPLDNTAYRDESLEFGVFSRLHTSGQTNQFSHWGAVSWKFTQKTGLDSQSLLRTLREAPDVDVFYMNPYPYNEALHVSPWWQGETAHPDFLQVSEAFLRAAGFDHRLCHRLTPGHEYSLCNYLIGTPLFWTKYLDFVGAALVQAEQHMPVELLRKMHSTEADWSGIHHQSTYVPFIIERLFGVFLRSEAGQTLKTKQLPCPLGEARMDAELRELREAKRVALLTKSVRVLEWWQRKRIVYFESRYGPGWCRRHLDRVMSADILF